MNNKTKLLHQPGLSDIMQAKVKHVRAAQQTRKHECHWPGCAKQVPPAQWGCGPHWFKLPKYLRDLIWATYRPGQEISMTPSAEYLDAANAVQQWIHAQPEFRNQQKRRTK